MNRIQERLRNTIGITAFACFICVCLASAVPGGEKDAHTKKTEKLNEKLKQVRKELAAANEEAAKKNKEYFQFEHDIVYTNEAASRIYSEIKQLEKTLVEKRKELAELTNKLPETRELMKEREALFKRRADLMDQEQLILNEIKVEQWRSGETGRTSRAGN